jgi:hypothetical protein
MTTLMTAFDGVQVPTRQDPVNFPARGDDMMSRFPPFQTQINTITGEVNANTVSAAASAAQALASSNAAVAVSNTTKWVSGTAYADGQVVWSPITKLSYRRSGAGSGTTDPSQDGANYTLVTPVAGFGGTVSSGTVVLTNASSGAQSMTPTTWGQGFQLPDATTCNEGATLFSLQNDGAFPAKITDSAGTLKGFIPPKSVVSVGLSDNTTAAGVWNLFGADRVGVTAVAKRSSPSNVFQVVAIDANRFFLLSSESSQLLGTVYDASTNTFGSTTLIRSVSGLYQAAAMLSAANQILVTSCTTTTAMEAVTLTISGTGITVNTAVPTTLATGINLGMFLATVNSTPVLFYARGTAGGCLRTLIVTGTAPAFGTEATDAALTSPAGLFTPSGTVGLAAGGNGTNARWVPFTVSGSTVTPGTAASWASTPQTRDIGVRQFGSRYLHFAGTQSGLVSVAGTVASVSTFSCGASASISSGRFVDGQISATKWFAAGAGTYQIVTDTAGTASIASSSGPGSIGQAEQDGHALVRLDASRATVYVKLTASGQGGSSGLGVSMAALEFDVSGATPVHLATSSMELTLPAAITEAGLVSQQNTVSPPRLAYSSGRLGGANQAGEWNLHGVSGSMNQLGKLTASVPVQVGGAMIVEFPGEGQLRAKPCPSLSFYPRSNALASGSSQQAMNSFPISDRKLVSFAGGITGTNTGAMYITELAA